MINCRQVIRYSNKEEKTHSSPPLLVQGSILLSFMAAFFNAQATGLTFTPFHAKSGLENQDEGKLYNRRQRRLLSHFMGWGMGELLRWPTSKTSIQGKPWKQRKKYINFNSTSNNMVFETETFTDFLHNLFDKRVRHGTLIRVMNSELAAVVRTVVAELKLDYKVSDVLTHEPSLHGNYVGIVSFLERPVQPRDLQRWSAHVQPGSKVVVMMPSESSSDFKRLCYEFNVTLRFFKRLDFLYHEDPRNKTFIQKRVKGLLGVEDFQFLSRWSYAVIEVSPQCNLEKTTWPAASKSTLEESVLSGLPQTESPSPSAEPQTNVPYPLLSVHFRYGGTLRSLTAD